MLVLMNSDGFWTSLRKMRRAGGRSIQVNAAPMYVEGSKTDIKRLGTIKVDGDEYAVNQEFQESANQLAEALNLDELESARLLLEVQEDAESLGRSIVASAVFQFHQRRIWLLECLRMVLRQATNVEIEEEIREAAQNTLGLILETNDGPARNGSLYIRRCLDAMSEIEKWTQALAERIQGALALGQTPTLEFDEVMSFQQQSLGQQHESLGAIVNSLIKAKYSGVEDFFKLLEYMPNVTRWNALALHYVPILTAFIAEYGSPNGCGSLRDARILNKRIMDSRESAPWPLRNLQAAMLTWWLAEYSGWYSEQPTGSPVQGIDFEEDRPDRRDRRRARSRCPSQGGGEREGDVGLLQLDPCRDRVAVA